MHAAHLGDSDQANVPECEHMVSSSISEWGLGIDPVRLGRLEASAPVTGRQAGSWQVSPQQLARGGQLGKPQCRVTRRPWAPEPRRQTSCVSGCGTMRGSDSPPGVLESSYWALGRPAHSREQGPLTAPSQFILNFTYDNRRGRLDARPHLPGDDGSVAGSPT